MSSDYDYDACCNLLPSLTLADTTPSSSSGGGSKPWMVGVKKTTKNKKTLRKSGRLTEQEIIEMNNKRKNNKLIGVYKTKDGMYVAKITYPDGRPVTLGTFMTWKLAASAYDEASLKLYRLEKPVNFPHRVCFRPIYKKKKLQHHQEEEEEAIINNN